MCHYVNIYARAGRLKIYSTLPTDHCNRPLTNVVTVGDDGSEDTRAIFEAGVEIEAVEGAPGKFFIADVYISKPACKGDR